MEKKTWQDFVSIDDLIEAGTKTNWIDNLINSSCLSDEEKATLEAMNCDDLDPEFESMFIGYLLENQVDRIDAGFNYSMVDIQRKLKSL